MTDNNWDYFTKDVQYSDVLKERLAAGIEMDSAKALATHLERACDGDIRIVDFGAGPGHYYPVLKRHYTKGSLSYLGVDIDQSNVRYGTEYFKADALVELRIGSVLEPEPSTPADVTCVISANTLPHVPSIQPLLTMLAAREGLRYFIFRMLVGSECVQIKKHLREHDFDHMFERDYQLNNIYSLSYFHRYLGSSWHVDIEPDIFDAQRLATHRVPGQDADPFYSNRVSRPIGSMIFKGDIYMPWKFVVGRRIV